MLLACAWLCFYCSFWDFFRPVQELFIDDDDFGGINSVVTLMVELGRAFERIVLIVEASINIICRQMKAC